MAAEPACLSTADDMVHELNDFVADFCPSLPRKLFCSVTKAGEFSLRLDVSGLSFSDRAFGTIIRNIRLTPRRRKHGRRWTVDLAEAHAAMRTRFVQRHSFGKLLYVKAVEDACPVAVSDLETCKKLVAYLLTALMRALDKKTELGYDGF